MKQLLPLTLLISIFIACNSGEEQHEKGKALASKYCGSCHLAVSPSLLDKETWAKHVLPAMAPKLGIGVWHDAEYYPANKKTEGAVTFEEWTEIVAYYKAMAPDSLLPAKVPVPLKEDGNWFRIKQPVWNDTTALATTSMVSVNPQDGRIYSGNDAKASLLSWDKALQSSLVMKLESGPVDMTWEGKDTALLTCIGNLRAVDVPKGTLWEVSGEHIKTIGLGLPRPVQSIAADFNKDGLTDYMVCGFGHNYGGLYLLQQKADGDFDKRSIWDVPGAIHAVTGDFNKDGWTDVMVLFAAADEGIWLFENDQKGGFKPKNLLRFPPVYGSTGFQLADMNKDGKPDIIYTAGDNADYSMVMKPYHGVYVYLNKGDDNYEQAYFYPVNGCTKAIAADFDGDGDLDIATIAFFADLKHHPIEKFIYFEQTQALQFVPHAVAQLAAQGRWICMDAGDYDRDGDIDILLGNYSNGFIIQDHFKPNWNVHQPIIVLENTYSFKK